MRVLVADDHSLFRDGIISLLEAADISVVGQVGDGQAAVDATLNLHPDLVPMDIDMPKMDGLEAVRRTRAELPKTQVVMLTVSEADDDIMEAIKSGAHGHLPKDLRAEELLDMLEGLVHGEAAMSRKTAARLIHGLGTPSRQPPGPAQRLTEREIELLQLVAEGSPKKTIALELSTSEYTVKYHMKRILEKLGVHNRTEAVTHAIWVGLIDFDSLG